MPLPGKTKIPLFLFSLLILYGIALTNQNNVFLSVSESSPLVLGEFSALLGSFSAETPLFFETRHF